MDISSLGLNVERWVNYMSVFEMYFSQSSQIFFLSYVREYLELNGEIEEIKV